MSPNPAGLEPAFCFLSPGELNAVTSSPTAGCLPGSTHDAVDKAEYQRIAEEREATKHHVLAMAEDIFERYMAGESMRLIAESMPFKISSNRLRDILLNNPDTREAYADIHIHRSHSLVEAAVDYAREAGMLGDAAGLRVAIDANLKVAAKINARDYGDKSKVELTGKDGGSLELKADLTLTAEQAYERLIKGK